MKKILIAMCMTLIFGYSMANQKAEYALAKYAWEKRQLIVFTPNLEHPQYLEFNNTLTLHKPEFEDRKLQSWHIIGDSIVKLDNTLKADINNQDFRDAFAIKHDEFIIVLIGYDQSEKLRQRKVNIDAIISTIDQMPMRQREIK